MGYLNWNNAIYNHFYLPNQRKTPVLLSIDDHILNEIGQEIGISDDPVGNFIHFVRVQSRLRASHGSKFGWFTDLIPSWRLQPKVFPYPPYIGLLSLTVLSASRMSSQENFSSNNYYIHLRELLAADQITENEKLKLDSLWMDLHYHLEVEGRVSTIHTHEHFIHIGYPLSQIFLRRADIERFPNFFRWVDLTPELLACDDRLLQKLFQWAYLPTSHLNTRFNEFVESDMFDEQSQRDLATILRQEYRNWLVGEQDGPEAPGRRNGGGSNTRTFSLLMEDDLSRFIPKLVYKFTGDPPDEEVIAQFLESWDGEEPDINPDTGWISIPLQPDQLSDALDRGVEIHLGSTLYGFTPTSVLMLGNDRDNWSGWISQAGLAFSERQAVLAHRELCSPIEEFLKRYAKPDWWVMQVGRDHWIFLDVIIPQQMVSPPADERLACLVPRLQVSYQLQGGANLSHHCWVRGFEPTLFVNTPVDIYLDDRLIEAGPKEISLAGLGLGAGKHTLQVGLREVPFFLDDLTQEKPYDSDRSGGYRVEGGNVLFYPILAAGEKPPGVIIRGAQVSDEQEHRIRLIPNNRQFVVLGYHPGEVYEVSLPNRIAGPTYIPVPFAAQWLITIGQKNRRYLHLVGRDRIEWEPVKGKIPGLRDWHRWVCRRFENCKKGTAKPFHYQELWNVYRQLA